MTLSGLFDESECDAFAHGDDAAGADTDANAEGAPAGLASVAEIETAARRSPSQRLLRLLHCDCRAIADERDVELRCRGARTGEAMPQ